MSGIPLSDGIPIKTYGPDYRPRVFSAAEAANMPQLLIMSQAAEHAEYLRQKWERENPGAPRSEYQGPSATILGESRIASIPQSEKFRQINKQYKERHFAIASTSGLLIPSGPEGSYVNVATGERFRANVLTTYQRGALNQVLASDQPAMQDLLAVRGLERLDAGVLSREINAKLGNIETSSRLAGFLSDPTARKPYETYFWGTGQGATARTAMQAKFVGKGKTPLHQMVPGSVQERFGFDEYGKVLRPGQKFEPAYSNEGVPYNPKMGHGDYVYVGEYHYAETGEVVSRYYETNVGSFVDVDDMGVFGPHITAVRSGAGPSGFYDTNLPPGMEDLGSAERPVITPTPGATEMGQDRISKLFFGMGAGATASKQPIALPDIGGAWKDLATEVNTNIFQKTAGVFGLGILADVNKAGRVSGIEQERSGLIKDVSPELEEYGTKVKEYEKRLGEYNAGGGQGQEDYNKLIAERESLMLEESEISSKIGRIEALESEQLGLKTHLTKGDPFLKSIFSPLEAPAEEFYKWSVGAGKTYERHVGEPLNEIIGSPGKTYNIAGIEIKTRSDRGVFMGTSDILLSGLKGQETHAYTFGSSDLDKSVLKTVIATPKGALDFAGMIPAGAVILAENPATIPALAMAGIFMQAEGIAEGIRTRPVEFIAEQGAMMAIFHYGGKAVKAGSPVGAGVFEAPSFESGLGARYYMAYVKKPFSKVSSGGRILGGVSRINTALDEVHMYTRAKSLEVGRSGMKFEASIDTFKTTTEAQNYFRRAAGIERQFYHATGDVGFINKLISERKVQIQGMSEGAMFFGSPDTIYSKFLKGAPQSRTIGGGIVRLTAAPEISAEFINAATKMEKGATMAKVAPTLEPGLYPGIRAWAGKRWKSVGLENEFIVPEGSQLKVTGVNWVEYGGKRVPIVDVTMGRMPTFTGQTTGFVRSRVANLLSREVKTRGFLGSPVELMKTHDIAIENPWAVTTEWNRATYAAVNARILAGPESTASRVWVKGMEAAEASTSRFYHPEQRELLGEEPTPSATKATMGELFRDWQTFGQNIGQRLGLYSGRPSIVIGGSRTLRAWVGEAGRGPSLADVDIWVKKSKMTDLYKRSLAIVEKASPWAGKEKHTYAPNMEAAEPSFSIVTGSDKFLGAHTIEQYGYVAEDVVRIRTVGGGEVFVPTPAAALRMKMSGMFSGIRQRAGGEVEFVAGRGKDVVDAYSLTRTMASDLYVPSRLDVGNVVTRHKTGQARSLEAFSDAARDYLFESKDQASIGMFKEIRRDPLAGINRNPEAVHDLLTGHGIVPRRYESAYQMATSIATVTAIGTFAGPMVGIPKLFALTGVVLPGMKGSKGIVAGQARLTGGQLRLYKGQAQLGKWYEEGVLTAGEKTLDVTRGTAESTRLFSKRFLQEAKAGGSSKFYETILEAEHAHSHPISATTESLFGKKIAGELKLAPSPSDVKGMFALSAKQEVIVTRTGALLMEVPESVRRMLPAERLKYVEEKGFPQLVEGTYERLVPEILKGQRIDAPVDIWSAESLMKLSYPERQKIGQAMVHAREAELILFSEATGVKLTRIKDINPETGVGRVSGFSPEAQRLASAWTGEKGVNVKVPSTLEAYPDIAMGSSVEKAAKRYATQVSRRQPVYDVSAPTGYLPKVQRRIKYPVVPFGISGQLLVYPMDQERPDEIYAMAASPVDYPSGVVATRYPAALLVQDYPSVTAVEDYPVAAPSRYPAAAGVRPYPVRVLVPEYPTAPVEPEYPIAPVYPRVTEVPEYPTTTTPTELLYPPLVPPPTYPPLPPPPIYPPHKTRRGKIKKKRKAKEWYIWNPVPTMETVFGTQLDIKKAYPQAEQPEYLIGNDEPKMVLPRASLPKSLFPKYRYPKIRF